MVSLHSIDLPSTPLILCAGVKTATASNPDSFSATRRIEPNQARVDDVSQNVAGEMEMDGLFTTTERRRHNMQDNRNGNIQRQMGQVNADLLANFPQPGVPPVDQFDTDLLANFPQPGVPPVDWFDTDLLANFSPTGALSIQLPMNQLDTDLLAGFPQSGGPSVLFPTGHSSRHSVPLSHGNATNTFQNPDRRQFQDSNCNFNLFLYF